jgi:hypothetical protein
MFGTFSVNNIVIAHGLDALIPKEKKNPHSPEIESRVGQPGAKNKGDGWI